MNYRKYLKKGNLNEEEKINKKRTVLPILTLKATSISIVRRRVEREREDKETKGEGKHYTIDAFGVTTGKHSFMFIHNFI